MRIPTITLALLAATLSGSVGARLTKASKAAAPGPAFLAARDYAERAVAPDAHADIQRRQGDTPDPSVVIDTVGETLAGEFLSLASSPLQQWCGKHHLLIRALCSGKMLPLRPCLLLLVQR